MKMMKNGNWTENRLSNHASTGTTRKQNFKCSKELTQEESTAHGGVVKNIFIFLTYNYF